MEFIRLVGLELIITVLWITGLMYVIKYTDEKYDNSIAGLLGYLLFTGLLMYLFG